MALAEQKPINVPIEMTRLGEKRQGKSRPHNIQVCVDAPRRAGSGDVPHWTIHVTCGQWVGIVFLLFFMPVAFFLVARKFIAAFRRKVKAASRADEI